MKDYLEIIVKSFRTERLVINHVYNIRVTRNYIPNFLPPLPQEIEDGVNRVDNLKAKSRVHAVLSTVSSLFGDFSRPYKWMYIEVDQGIESMNSRKL